MFWDGAQLSVELPRVGLQLCWALRLCWSLLVTALGAAALVCPATVSWCVGVKACCVLGRLVAAVGLCWRAGQAWGQLSPAVATLPVPGLAELGGLLVIGQYPRARGVP